MTNRRKGIAPRAVLAALAAVAFATGCEGPSDGGEPVASASTTSKTSTLSGTVLYRERIGLPAAESCVLSPLPAGVAGANVPGEDAAERAGAAPSFAVPAAAASLTSFIVTTPPAPLGATRARSTPSR